MSQYVVLQRIRKSVRPSDNWGPALDKYRTAYMYQLKQMELNDSDSNKLSPDDDNDSKLNGIA